jgi:hypothetical protein
VVVLGALGLTILAAGCNDENGADTVAAAASTAAQLDAGASSALVAAPVSQFSILVQDLGIQNFLTDINRTWDLTRENYSKTRAFESESAGREHLASWGYVEGFETALVPEGGVQALLNGGYIVHQEIHLFDSARGAAAAFEYFQAKVRGNGVSEPLNVPVVGDESFVSRTLGQVLGGGGSQVRQELHQVIFRRANVVAVILTIGAEPIIDVDTVLELSAMVDEKIRGDRPHPSPTPIPGRTDAK